MSLEGYPTCIPTKKDLMKTLIEEVNMAYPNKQDFFFLLS